MGKTLSIIVAVAEDYGIGMENKLLAYVSNDLKRFKKITSNHTIVMGRNTFLSLPNGALPNRKNIVITDTDEQFEGCTMVHSIEEAIDQCPENDESFIIGGAMIYKQFYPIANKIYLTRFHKTFSADTYFPTIIDDEWLVLDTERIEKDDQVDFSYSFITLQRK
jgi:dihydrofolate reductase